jgi:MFS family permease
MTDLLASDAARAPDGPHAWLRLFLALITSTVGAVGLWSTVVVLPAIEAEFGVDRGAAAFPYTATMIGFAIGGLIMGRLVDRVGIAPPVFIGGLSLGAGYMLSALAESYWMVIACQTFLIGMFGSSSCFGAMVADISHWFLHRRGIAVAIVASGSYLAGAVWPPLIQHWIEADGWRAAHVNVGLICLIAMPVLAYLLRRRPVIDQGAAPVASRPVGGRAPASPRVTQALLVVAGFGCCMAMAMPQVHIVAYCVDLGYGAATGTEMLSIMLVLGIVSRLASGVIADRIGGVGTLLIGSGLQCLALIFYLPFDGPTSLYLVSALFGLSQGGIVPSYALIVREVFPAREAGIRIAYVMTATIIGMAAGGWISGLIYDATGSYATAFLHGIVWNLINLSIAFWLLHTRLRGDPRPVAA